MPKYNISRIVQPCVILDGNDLLKNIFTKNREFETSQICCILDELIGDESCTDMSTICRNVSRKVDLQVSLTTILEVSVRALAEVSSVFCVL